MRPVESGHRVCLVFNLLRGAASDTPPASAPSHDAEVAEAARLIGAAFAAEDAPRKLVWPQAPLFHRGIHVAQIATSAGIAAARRVCPTHAKRSFLGDAPTSVAGALLPAEATALLSA